MRMLYWAIIICSRESDLSRLEFIFDFVQQKFYLLDSRGNNSPKLINGENELSHEINIWIRLLSEFQVSSRIPKQVGNGLNNVLR